jgi:cell division protein FtsZ
MGMAIDMIQDDAASVFDAGTVIKVIGVGGGGGNAVAHMIRSDVQGIEFVFANTDSQDLSKAESSTVVQLGNTGQGAGSKPDVGRQLTEEAEDGIRAVLAGANLVFITAGMGGGTGTGGAPVIARIAREMNILTVAVVTKPFEFEGPQRMLHADNGLQELQANVDALIVVLNDKLLEVYGDDVEMDEAFGFADDILKNAVRGISDIINVKGKINVDFADVRTIMSNPGKALMGIASAEGEGRAARAANDAIACPLLEGVDLKQAKGLLVVISSGKGLKLRETNEIMTILKGVASEDSGTTIKFGTVQDESLGDKLSVTVMATGLYDENAQAAVQPIVVVNNASLQQTGTGGRFDPPVLTPATAPVQGSPSDYSAELEIPPILRNKPRGTLESLGGFSASSGGSSSSAFGGGVASASSKIEALQLGGKSYDEIPAYIRRQAD